MQLSQLLFDKQDYELLHLVNRVLEQKSTDPEEHVLLALELHPHGIKDLAQTREMRIAYAVINLLHSLEMGQSRDRLMALSSLYDEVITVADASFRHNTGRVLIQIMKELIRAHGDTERQLQLAHNFRKAATGNRRFVRSMLAAYHLLEMPEAWNQLTFDHRVHDAHTKGRKTPTHLIMDAWIKGVRALTIIYYNFAEIGAVEELFRAAAIMGIQTSIGIEYRAAFRNKYVAFIWEPSSTDSLASITSFLQRPPVQELMEEGKEASQYYAHNILDVLQLYNARYRHDMTAFFQLPLPAISPEEFLQFVGSGQASLSHLSELVYEKLRTLFQEYMPTLQHAYQQASDPEDRERIEAQVKTMQETYPETLLARWLIPAKKPGIADPSLPTINAAVPPLLLVSALDLLQRLHTIQRNASITLALSNLTAEDVLALLYAAQGKISHLELFNLKDYVTDKATERETISKLQFAINQGSAIALKRLILDSIHTYDDTTDEEALERRKELTTILYNIPKLQLFYSKAPLRSKVGSDSTSRAYRLHGMGFALTKTLSPRAIKQVHDPHEDLRTQLPLQAQIEAVCTYTPPAEDAQPAPWYLRLLRTLPGCSYLGYKKKQQWQVQESSIRYSTTHSSIATLGGFRNETDETLSLCPPHKQHRTPFFPFVNTTAANILKVVFGFALTLATFAYTQQWWVLAWFGAPIWFGITGLRNIFQAVLAGRGFTRTSLLHWNDYVNWSRLSDSLFYTGLSVPLLELLLRWWILGKIFGLTASTNPLLFYSIISTVNGLYIASHNFIRGLQKEAIIGNLFRSVLAIPLSLLYNAVLVQTCTVFGFAAALPLLKDGAAIISKTASDTVAGIIEGFADRKTNLNMRHWDYNHKIKQFFACYSRLELLLPETNILEMLQHPENMFQTHSKEVNRLEKALLIHSLDCMYFLMYQPRAKTMLEAMLKKMSTEEKTIFVRAQRILERKKAVSQMFVDGMIGDNFSRGLSFFLTTHKDYLSTLSKLANVPLSADIHEQVA